MPKPPKIMPMFFLFTTKSAKMRQQFRYPAREKIICAEFMLSMSMVSLYMNDSGSNLILIVLECQRLQSFSVVCWLNTNLLEKN